MTEGSLEALNGYGKCLCRGWSIYACFYVYMWAALKVVPLVLEGGGGAMAVELNLPDHILLRVVAVK